MKAYSAKQIVHRLEKVDTFKNNFKREVIKTYGEENGIKFEKTNDVESIDGVDYPVYLVYDEKEDGENKTFKFIAQEYNKNGKSMIKVIKIL